MDISEEKFNKLEKIINDKNYDIEKTMGQNKTLGFIA